MGRTYAVAEAGHSEIVSPVPMMRQIVREELSTVRSGAAVTVNINSPLITTSGLSDSDLRAASDKLLASVNEGLRRLGKKQL
jgi:hypothetical protein